MNPYVFIKKVFAKKKANTLSISANQEFLKLQIERFFDHLGLDNSVTHTKYLLPIISSLKGMNSDSKILIIGPCNHRELDAFEAHGYNNFVAIDLVSTDPRILVMDMHDLTFDDKSFDLIYATNVLHCTQSPKSLGNSIYRVTKEDGYLVLGVTVDLPSNDPVYVTDYKTVKGILAILPRKVKLVYEKIVEPKSDENPHSSRFLKCIVQKISEESI